MAAALTLPRGGDIRDAVRKALDAVETSEAVMNAVATTGHVLACCAVKDLPEALSSAGAAVLRMLSAPTALAQAAGLRMVQLMAAGIRRGGGEGALDSREAKRLSTALLAAGSAAAQAGSPAQLALALLTLRAWVRVEPHGICNQDSVVPVLGQLLLAARESTCLPDAAAFAAEVLLRRFGRSRTEGEHHPVAWLVWDVVALTGTEAAHLSALWGGVSVENASPGTLHAAAAVLLATTQASVGSVALPLKPLVAALRGVQGSMADALAAVPSSGALTGAGAAALAELGSATETYTSLLALLAGVVAVTPCPTAALLEAAALVAAVCDALRLNAALVSCADTTPSSDLPSVVGGVTLATGDFTTAVLASLGSSCCKALQGPLLGWVGGLVGSAAHALTPATCPPPGYAAPHKSGRGVKRGRGGGQPSSAATLEAARQPTTRTVSDFGQDYIALDDVAPPTTAVAAVAAAGYSGTPAAALLVPVTPLPFPGAHTAPQQPLQAVSLVLDRAVAVWGPAMSLPLTHPTAALALRLVGAAHANARFLPHALPTAHGAVGAWGALKRAAQSILVAAQVQGASPQAVLETSKSQRRLALEAAAAAAPTAAPATAQDAGTGMGPTPVHSAATDVAPDTEAEEGEDYEPGEALATQQAAGAAAPSPAQAAGDADSAAEDSDDDEELPDIV